MEYLNLIVILQILFLFCVLFFKNNNYINKLLAIIILIPSVSFCFNTLDVLGLLSVNLYGYSFFIIQPLAFLFAPFVFYYINIMCGKRTSLKHPLFIVTASMLVYLFYALACFIGMNDTSKEEYVYSIVKGESLEIIALSILFIVIQQIYFTIGAYRVFIFRKRAHNVFSARSILNIQFTLRFTILIWLLNISTLISYIFFSIRTVEFIILPLVLFIINNFIFYYAFKFHAFFNEDTYKIFLKDLKLINSINAHTEIKEKTNENILHPKNIKSFLEKEKSYLKLDYTIIDLSKDLNFPHSEVSSVINKEMNMNFSRLINDYRVEESKLILKEKFSTLTIEAIGELSGFKSRASFYRAFKSKTGMTPSEYIKS